MKNLEGKSLNSPDEVRKFDKGKVEIVKVSGVTIGRAVLEPGWKWSECVKPVAKTKSCEAPHFQYHVSGVLKVKMDNGAEKEFKAGDISFLPSGHDAWVVGKEPVVVVDFQGMVHFAESSVNKAASAKAV